MSEAGVRQLAELAAPGDAGGARDERADDGAVRAARAGAAGGAGRRSRLRAASSPRSDGRSARGAGARGRPPPRGPGERPRSLGRGCPFGGAGQRRSVGRSGERSIRCVVGGAGRLRSFRWSLGLSCRRSGRCPVVGERAGRPDGGGPAVGGCRPRRALGDPDRGPRSTARTATIPAQRGAPSIERGRATGRAYARREDRLRKLVGGRAPRTAPTAGRAKFVLLVMGLLAVGLIVTLWLSTAAAADSYRLQDARVAARALSEQSEQLRREVMAMDAAPALAQRAAALGMVPVQDSARLVVGPDGAVTLVGTPKAAIATAPPAPPAPVVAPNGTTPARRRLPNGATPTATPTAAPGPRRPEHPDRRLGRRGRCERPHHRPHTAATPTPAPNGQANRTSTTATPRAGAPTSAPATSAAAASRTPAAAANAARSAADPHAQAHRRGAAPPPRPSGTAR